VRFATVSPTNILCIFPDMHDYPIATSSTFRVTETPIYLIYFHSDIILIKLTDKTVQNIGLCFGIQALHSEGLEFEYRSRDALAWRRIYLTFLSPL
jgi:hypothetical protein